MKVTRVYPVMLQYRSWIVCPEFKCNVTKCFLDILCITFIIRFSMWKIKIIFFSFVTKGHMCDLFKGQLMWFLNKSVSVIGRASHGWVSSALSSSGGITHPNISSLLSRQCVSVMYICYYRFPQGLGSASRTNCRVFKPEWTTANLP